MNFGIPVLEIKSERGKKRKNKKPPNGKVIKGSISVEEETVSGIIAEIFRKFRDGRKMRKQTIYCAMGYEKYINVAAKVKRGKLGHLKRYENGRAYFPNCDKCIFGTISVKSYHDDGVVAKIEKEYVEDHLLKHEEIECAMTTERYDTVRQYVEEGKLNNLLYYEHGEGYPPSEFPDL